MRGITLLTRLLETVPPRLEAIPDSTASKSQSADKWSAKQELGHLLDSAANNHQRLVRGLLQENPAMPGYEQRAWVDLHNYQSRDWQELIALWQALNRQLLAAAKAVPNSARTRTMTIAASEPLTIEFVFEDYIEHMLHHLAHIGIEIADLKPETAAAD